MILPTREKVAGKGGNSLLMFFDFEKNISRPRLSIPLFKHI